MKQTFVALLLTHEGLGLPQFMAKIPNADKVTLGGVSWPAVAHTTATTVTGAFNPFGEDAVASGLPSSNFVWANSDLCRQDSDGDGVTNGDELGDPGCVWEPGSEATRLEDITHPGFDEANATEILNGIDDSTPILIKAHIVLMCFAWMVLAPIGIMTALIHKKFDPNDVKLPVHWFEVHKFCMSSTAACTLAGWACMIAYLEDVKFDTEHTLFGFFVVLLTIIQPVSGVFRPHIPPQGEAKSKVRLAWEYSHQWTGRLAVVFSVVALYYGFKVASETFGLIEESLGDSLTVLIWTLFTLASIFSILYIFLYRDYEFCKARSFPSANSAASSENDSVKVEMEEKSEDSPRGLNLT